MPKLMWLQSRGRFFRCSFLITGSLALYFIIPVNGWMEPEMWKSSIRSPVSGLQPLVSDHQAISKFSDSLSTSEEDRAVLRHLPNNAFRIGERLVFSVEYGPVKAGQAIMEVPEIVEVNGRRCYHVIFEAKSSELFSNFFEVKDRVESFMDVDGLFPWRFEKHLREGNFRSDMRIEYDQINHIAITNKDTMDVPPFVQDILSGFYYGRIQELQIGKTIYIDHHSGRKIYPLKVKVLKKDRVKVPAGVFTCVVIEPVLKAVGIFKHTGRLRVWLTDDERKIPVLMKSKMIIGSVAAKLIEYDVGENE